MFANDNGVMFWPPECDLIRWDTPVAQAWEKFDDPAERRKIKERRESMRCTTRLRVWEVAPSREVIEDAIDEEMSVRYVPGNVRLLWLYAPCGAVVSSWRAAPLHQAERHPGQTCTFDYVHARWVYEMMGFEDLYDGNPQGWYNLLDGRDPTVRQWERDALELGTATADYLWQEPSAA